MGGCALSEESQLRVQLWQIFGGGIDSNRFVLNEIKENDGALYSDADFVSRGLWVGGFLVEVLKARGTLKNSVD
jgi:hypothetical protein